MAQAVVLLDDRRLSGGQDVRAGGVSLGRQPHVVAVGEACTWVPFPLPGGPIRIIFFFGGVSSRRLTSARRSSVDTERRVSRGDILCGIQVRSSPVQATQKGTQAPHSLSFGKSTSYV